tara:strand:+ start:126 stop:620 length:495 start_codon:yes stop_codon:yes gene_type:complete
MKKNVFFRSWFYFRQGWSVYFAFIFAALNTLIVTYYLAIENAPFLKSIFPSFIEYVVTLVAIGVPLLVVVGYAHYKRTSAYKSEAEITSESNPYMARIVSNSEMLLQLNLKMMHLIIKLTNDEKISESELNEVMKLQTEFKNFDLKRSIGDNKDMDFFRQIDEK